MIRRGDQLVWAHPILKRSITGTVKRVAEFNIFTDCDDFGSDSDKRTDGSISRARFIVEQRYGRMRVIRHATPTSLA